MSESNNVKFVEANGKWMWKRYDENGSVIYRSPEFDTERQARENYGISGSNSVNSSVPESAQETSTATPEGDISAGQVAPESEGQGADLV